MGQNNKALPDGWVWTTLGEATIVNPRDRELTELPPDLLVTFVPMAAVDGAAGAIAEPRQRQLAEVRKGFTSFMDGDVLFAKITPCMENGKAAVARTLINGRGFGSTEFHVLRPHPGILPEWVFYFVRQEEFRREAKANFAGTAGQLRVPAQFLTDHPLPLPPLAEQRRIVAAIEEQLTRLEAGVGALRRAQAKLRRYRAAVLKAACEGRLVPQDANDEPAGVLLGRILAERRAALGRLLEDVWFTDRRELDELPNGWAWATLPQLGELARGKSKHRPRDDQRLYGGPFPFVQTGDVRRANGTIRTYSQTYSELGLEQSRLWPTGTLCITIAANIADTAILGFDACFPDSVVGFIGASGACDVRYIEFFFHTAKENLERFAPATAQKNINLDTLQRLAIPLPPVAEQQRIVAEVERRLSVVEELEGAVAANLARAGRLRQAILKRAFEGRLVPQDPTDEPASALLERMREDGGRRGRRTEDGMREDGGRRTEDGRREAEGGGRRTEGTEDGGGGDAGAVGTMRD